MTGTVVRIAAWTLALALVALPLVAVVNGWVGAERWPLRTLRVQGELHRVDAARLQAILRPYAGRGFFAVQLDAAQATIRNGAPLAATRSRNPVMRAPPATVRGSASTIRRIRCRPGARPWAPANGWSSRGRC